MFLDRSKEGSCKHYTSLIILLRSVSLFLLNKTRYRVNSYDLQLWYNFNNFFFVKQNKIFLFNYVLIKSFYSFYFCSLWNNLKSQCQTRPVESFCCLNENIFSFFNFGVWEFFSVICGKQRVKFIVYTCRTVITRRR